MTIAYDPSTILNPNAVWDTIASRMSNVNGTDGLYQVSFSDEEAERIVRESLKSIAAACNVSSSGVSSAS